MTERGKIMGRIREALRVPARAPGLGHNGHPEQAPGAATSDFRQVLPAVGAGFAERLELFRKLSANLKTDFYLAQKGEDIAAVLRQLRDQERWTRIGAHRSDLLAPAIEALGLPVVYTDSPYAVRDLESCSAGLSACDALVAQTGSVLLTSRSAGGRALSVLPPHHVVIATSSQLLADLPEAFALLSRKYAADFPSFISFITGPSRTGDIERILVLGAHGPKKLTVILLQET